VTNPSLRDLLQNSPKNWGRWGADDEVGSLNFLTPAEVLRGVSEVRDGKVFTLQRVIGGPGGDPVWPGRTEAVRSQVFDESSWREGGDAEPQPGDWHCADDRIEMYLQGSTQYDALGHLWHDGQIYNGYDAETTVGGLEKASVEAIGTRGVVGRGVLLDIARHRGVDHLGTGDTIGIDELLDCARTQGSEIQPHDIVVVRTNHVQRFYDDKEAFYSGDFVEPGLVYSPQLVDWFHRMEIPNLVTDCIANETTIDPNNGCSLVLHNALMRNLGVAFTEICDLEALAADCAEDGRYTFLYAAAPLKVHKASGSPVNPLAMK
jgi:kynurenine formamidase